MVHQPCQHQHLAAAQSVFQGSRYHHSPSPCPTAPLDLVGPPGGSGKWFPSPGESDFSEIQSPCYCLQYQLPRPHSLVFLAVLATGFEPSDTYPTKIPSDQNLASDQKVNQPVY
uniref:Uncharacterized protein n=1 Tax=Opuntia streptacantha TaxID=393608 RepID=A0A7C9ELL8_OPUST